MEANQQSLEDLLSAIHEQFRSLRQENRRLQDRLRGQGNHRGGPDRAPVAEPAQDITEAEMAAMGGILPFSELDDDTPKRSQQATGYRRTQSALSQSAMSHSSGGKKSHNSEEGRRRPATHDKDVRRGSTDEVRRGARELEGPAPPPHCSRKGSADFEAPPPVPEPLSLGEATQAINALVAGVDVTTVVQNQESQRKQIISLDAEAAAAERPSLDQTVSESQDGYNQEPYEVIPQIWPGWLTEAGEENCALAPAFLRSEAATIITKSGNFFHDEEQRTTNCQRLILSPESSKRVMWDVLALCVLGYDVMMTPLAAFDLQETPAMTAVDLFTTVFWTVDIFVTFLTGFRKVYSVELRPLQIAKHYAVRGFLPDVSVALFDWTMFVLKSGMADSANLIRMSKLARIARIFRVLRLFRLLRLPNIFKSLKGLIHSDAAMGVVKILRSLLIIIFVNHFVACGWYFIGTLEGYPSWVQTMDEENREFTYRYVTALHWSITQFTPASMEVMPRNASERAFSIIVVFFGLVLFSSFVSSITTTMAALRMSRYQEVSTKDKIRRYMVENGVSMQLGARISTFLLSYRFTTRKPIHRVDIPIFRVLPKNLQLMLDWEVYHPVLKRHPLFCHIGMSDTVSMLQLCGLVEEIALSTCEELFHPGQQAIGTYFTLSGVIRCYHGFEESNPLEIDCAQHQWLCEPALWLRWRHRGRVVAVTTCNFYVLGHSALHSVAVGRPMIQKVCMAFAKLVRQRFENIVKEDFSENGSNNLDMMADFADDRDAIADIANTALQMQEVGRSQKRIRGTGLNRMQATLSRTLSGSPDSASPSRNSGGADA